MAGTKTALGFIGLCAILALTVGCAKQPLPRISIDDLPDEDAWSIWLTPDDPDAGFVFRPRPQSRAGADLTIPLWLDGVRVWADAELIDYRGTHPRTVAMIIDTGSNGGLFWPDFDVDGVGPSVIEEIEPRDRYGRWGEPVTLRTGIFRSIRVGPFRKDPVLVDLAEGREGLGPLIGLDFLRQGRVLWFDLPSSRLLIGRDAEDELDRLGGRLVRLQAVSIDGTPLSESRKMISPRTQSRQDLIAWAEQIANESRRNETIEFIDSIPDDAFDEPPGVMIAVGTSDTQHHYVESKVEGEQFPLLMDTGYSRSVVYFTDSPPQDLSRARRFRSGDFFGTSGPIYRLPDPVRVEIAGIDLGEHDAYWKRLSKHWEQEHPYVILGLPVLQGMRFGIDFQNSEVLLLHPE